MLTPPLALALALLAPPLVQRPAPPELPPESAALRALQLAAAGDPGVEEVQAAAARQAERGVPDPAALPGRARLSALLPRLTLEYRHDEQSNRTVGLQGSGEVDYLRLAPGNTFTVRATWTLPELVAGRGELAAGAAAVARTHRQREAAARATALHFERRRRRVELLLAAPGDALALAAAELEIARLTAELDALTGGLYARARR